MISVITWVAAVIAFSFAVQDDKAPKEIYQDGYGTYDLESGLMIEYTIPEINISPTGEKKGLTVSNFTDGGTAPKSNFAVYVTNVDNQDIRNHSQTFYMCVNSELDELDSYYVYSNPEIKLHVYSPWEQVRSGKYLHKFKPYRTCPFPFNPKNFLFSELIKIQIDDNQNPI